MGHTNTKYYCLEHPNRATTKYCTICKSSMCNSCVKEHNDICPACRREYSIKTTENIDKRTLIIVLFFGLFGVLITYLFLLIKYDGNALSHLFPQGYIFFFLGISGGYTFYLFEDRETFRGISEIPFFGFKLVLIIYLLTVASFIPALMYLWKVFMYCKSSKKVN